ncbi:MAG: hypothetical protein WHS44_03585 [Fimbriimonadales bacterium]|nr:MAG: hypothetical protein KatS3mg018_1822 [Fimbriimonadales bacterium]
MQTIRLRITNARLAYKQPDGRYELSDTPVTIHATFLDIFHGWKMDIPKDALVIHGNPPGFDLPDEPFLTPGQYAKFFNDQIRSWCAEANEYHAKHPDAPLYEILELIPEDEPPHSHHDDPPGIIY